MFVQCLSVYFKAVEQSCFNCFQSASVSTKYLCVKLCRSLADGTDVYCYDDHHWGFY